MAGYSNETIAAIVTPPGVGAIAVIRISGKDLIPLIRQVAPNKSITPREATFVALRHPGNHSVLDSCIITYFPSPASFTGEDVLEISCHGGEFVPNNILTALLSTGIRLAVRGEFSYRAFINGKIDLVQAESIASLISSKTELGADISIQNISGKLSTSVKLIKKNLLHLLTVLEHELDFSEEEITHTDKRRISNMLSNVSDEIKNLLKTTFFGKSIYSGYRIVIIGVPNAGKSSIYNNIIGLNKVLVSEIAGTTRDAVETWFEVEGFPVCLVDTAGYWDSDQPLDAMGVKKTLEEVETADLLLFVDPQDPVGRFKDFGRSDLRPITLFVKSKLDVNPDAAVGEGVISTSTFSNEGFDTLLTALSTRLSELSGKYSGHPIIASNRQRILMDRAFEQITDIQIEFKIGLEIDMLVSLMREVVDTLSEVTGEIFHTDILDNIFSSFCVGK